MTTAHRPTFDPWEKKHNEARLIIKDYFQLTHNLNSGQGGDAAAEVRDLRAELLQAEAAHFAKKNGGSSAAIEDVQSSTSTAKRQLENGSAEDDEDSEAKRRRILEETRDIDADSDDAGESDSSDDDRFAEYLHTLLEKGLHGASDDDEDETAELQRELEKIKRERAEKREQEERERLAAEEAEREHDIALGNPLLNAKSDFNVKRRWDDDVIFKNQARGTEDKGKKEFVNDLLRSDFHKKFMSKYVR